MLRYAQIRKDLVMNGLVSVVKMFSLILACLDVEWRDATLFSFLLRFLDWLDEEMLFLCICACISRES